MAKIKCAITGKVIPTTFLGKPEGTSIRFDGKLYWVSNDVQREYKNNKEKIIEAIRNK